MTVEASVTLDEMAHWDWSDLRLKTLTLEQVAVSLEHTLRFLPGRRLVVSGDCKLVGSEKAYPCVAKCMFGDKGRKEAKREYDNLLFLKEKGVKVPQVSGLYEDADGALLVMERLPDTIPVMLAMQREPGHVEALFDQLENLYRAGVKQGDIHPDNFIVSSGELFVLDAGKIEPLSGVAGSSRAKKDVTANLGLLLAQFSVGQQSIVHHFEKQIKKRFTFVDMSELQRIVEKKRVERIRKYINKTLRKNSAVRTFDDGVFSGLVDRSLAPSIVDKLLEAMNDEKADQYLKRGNSATVFRFQEWVVKRYNLKPKKQAGTRFWKSLVGHNRALRAWSMGRTWNHFGFLTPQPLLYAEREDGVTFLVSPYVEGDELAEKMRHEDSDQYIQQARAYLKNLHRYKFWHGDTKARNFLVCSQGQGHGKGNTANVDASASMYLMMIDLDAAGWGARPWYKQWYMRNRQEKDRLRFEKNL